MSQLSLTHREAVPSTLPALAAGDVRRSQLRRSCGLAHTVRGCAGSMAWVPVSLPRRAATTGGSRLSGSKHLHKGTLELTQLGRSEPGEQGVLRTQPPVQACAHRAPLRRCHQGADAPVVRRRCALDESAGRERLGGGGGYAKDPVCGMRVETANPGATSTHDGHTVYFCSDRCKTKYDKDPDKFEAGAEEPMSQPTGGPAAAGEATTPSAG